MKEIKDADVVAHLFRGEALLTRCRNLLMRRRTPSAAADGVQHSTHIALMAPLHNQGESAYTVARQFAK